MKKNNKGFSLVELIVVIAIMIVLVAVLAPVFTKYVERSRRATDIQNANTIAEAVLVDAADDVIKGDVADKPVTETDKPSAIKDKVVTKGNAVKAGNTFSYSYTAETNKVVVYVTGDTEKTDLTTEEGSQKYADGKTKKITD